VFGLQRDALARSTAGQFDHVAAGIGGLADQDGDVVGG
jgi:hypothetical protein